MKQMKNFKIALAVLAAVSALAMSLSSCSKDDGPYYPVYNGLVTIKTTDSGVTYFQLDKKTTLEPTNWKNPYKREVRALLQYSEEPGEVGLFSKKVKVAWIDSVRTKSAVSYDNEFMKGNNAPIELYNDWVTCLEDGYLTIHFAALFGRGGKIVHIVDLAVDPKTLDLYLKHDNNGDNGYIPGEGVIAFKIDDLLKDVKDGQELTLHWKGSEGEKTAKVKYLSRFALPQKSQSALLLRGTLSGDMEKVLVEQARNGDRAAMRQIYDCYSRYLAATCSRYLPDGGDLRDVLQDSFVKIFSSLGKFDYRGEGSLKAWMRQISVNEALKFIRKRKRSDTVEYKWDLPDKEEEEEPDVGSVPPGVIQKMIQAVPEGYRTVLNLYAFEEKSHKEIAALLGITESTSASQLHRARAILARQINEYKKRTETT